MTRQELIQTITYLAVLGNILFILWMTWNGIDEAFKGTIYQKLSYVGLTSLLILESWLLLRKPR